MKRLLSYLKPHKFVMTAATVLVLFIIVVELYRPIIIGDAIEAGRTAVVGISYHLADGQAQIVSGFGLQEA